MSDAEGYSVSFNYDDLHPRSTIFIAKKTTASEGLLPAAPAMCQSYAIEIPVADLLQTMRSSQGQGFADVFGYEPVRGETRWTLVRAQVQAEPWSNQEVSAFVKLPLDALAPQRSDRWSRIRSKVREAILSAVR